MFIYSFCTIKASDIHSSSCPDTDNYCKDGVSFVSMLVASFPGLRPDFISQPCRKIGRRPGAIYHVMSARDGVVH